MTRASNNNCAGVAVDVFMTMASRIRWKEVSDFYPDDYTAPTQDTVKIDDTWIGHRTRDNFTFDEAMEYRSTFSNAKSRARAKAKMQGGLE